MTGTYERVVAAEKADAERRRLRTPQENWVADRRLSLRNAIRDLQRAEEELSRHTNRGVQDCVRFIHQAEKDILDVRIKTTMHAFIAADEAEDRASSKQAAE